MSSVPSLPCFRPAFPSLPSFLHSFLRPLLPRSSVARLLIYSLNLLNLLNSTQLTRAPMFIPSSSSPTSGQDNVSSRTILARVASCTLRVFAENSKVDRVTIPLLKTMDLLLSNNVFDGMDALEADYIAGNGSSATPPAPPGADGSADGSAAPPTPTSFAEQCVEAVRAEIRGSGDVVKIISAMSVFLGLLQFAPPARTRSFQVCGADACFSYAACCLV